MRDRVRDEREQRECVRPLRCWTVLEFAVMVPRNRNLWVGDTVPAVWPGYDNSSTFKFGET
jgi:hypothetical protein